MLRWTWLFVILTSVGCGKGFRSAESPSVTAQTAAAAAPSTPANPHQISKADGQLSWALQSQSPTQGTTYSYDLKIGYGRIAKAASRVARQILPYSCQPLPGIYKDQPAAYAPGEIPCGVDVSSSLKRLIDIDVPDFKGRDDGFDWTVHGTTIPVEFSRQQRSGIYTESRLETKAPVRLQSSPNFGDDISWRYTPNGTNARLEMCMNVPGVEITAPTVKISAKASKRILGIKISHSSSFNITPGDAVYDYGRGCFAADFTWNPSTSAPQLAMKTTVNPYLSNVDYSGLHIHINDWFLRLVDKIVSLFTTSIRTRVVQMVTTKVNAIADSDVETGAWFTKIHADDMVKNTGQTMSVRLKRIMLRAGVPSNSADLRTLLHDKCRLIRFSQSATWTTRLDTLCSQIVDQTQIVMQPFAVDSFSQISGCYDHFANVHQSDGAWWSTQCKFEAKFSITLPPAYQDFITELNQVLAAHLDSLPDAWQAALNQYGLDSYMLSLLLEELEQKGYKQITPSDWTQGIPAVIADLKAKLAAGTL